MKEKLENELTYPDNRPRIDVPIGSGLPVVLKSKLLIVDLAGSERVDKNGLFLKLLPYSLFLLVQCAPSLCCVICKIPTFTSHLV